MFTFYNTLRHIAASFNILLRPLEEITKTTGVCQLTQSNCIGYEHAKDIMSTALHLKLTGNDYFKSFPKAQTFITAAANSSDGFRLLYRILEIIHPRLRLEKGGLHKTIDPPSYNDIADDSIYTFITRYKNYLLYEKLSPENRSYNKREQTMFIIKALGIDSRFKDGLVYVEATLQAYQRDMQITPTTPFPLDLDIEEIAITIAERSDAYTVGEKAPSPRVVNPYARVLDNQDTSVIRAMGRKDNNCKPQGNGGYQRYKSDKMEKPKIRNTQTCKACMGVGHCISNADTVCYVVAKAYICNRFMEDAANASIVKSNTYRYKKEQKEKAMRLKTSSRMDGIIKKMESAGHTDLQLAPMIHMANAMVDDSSDESNSDNESTSSSD